MAFIHDIEFDALMREYVAEFGEINLEERNLTITCPKCGKSGVMYFPEFIVKDSPTGITSFPVVPGDVCDHAFVIHVDRNFDLR